jgi:hypothetical protein
MATAAQKSRSSFFNRPVWLIAGFVLASAIVQATVIARATLPALDSLRSVAAAEALLRAPSVATLAAEPEPPLYPVWLACVHAMRGALASLAGGTPPTWALSVQIAAALPLLAWPIPSYFLARRVVGQRMAWVAGLLACFLPVAARLGGEGLADALYLPLFAGALAIAIVDRAAWRHDVLAGVCVGLAMLVRIEAMLLIPLIALSAMAPWRERWRAMGIRLVLLASTAAAVLLPRLAATDSLAPRAAVARLLSREPAREGWVFNQAIEPSEKLAAADPWVSEEYAFDSKEPGATTRRSGFLLAARETADELLVATGFVLIPLAALGIAFRRRFGLRHAWDQIAAIGAVVWLLLGFFNALATGYLSSRHLLPAAVFLLPWGTQGLMQIAYFQWDLLSPTARLRCAASAVLIGWTCWLLQPLHSDRAGHRAAGEWLTSHVGPGERVLDSWGWTSLYSGQETVRYDAAREAYLDPALRYVVVEQRELESGSPRGATMRRLLAEQGECVAELTSAGEQSPVLIFHWRPLLAHNDGSPATLR